MLMSRPNTLEQKKDLHFGGLGARAADSPTWAAVAPLEDSWARSGRNLMVGAQEWVRRNPLAAIALIGAAGVALGLFLARQD
jgi:ElaB/YqjD/DUF883 family membrane-anchored ribosome-binding protein